MAAGEAGAAAAGAGGGAVSAIAGHGALASGETAARFPDDRPPMEANAPPMYTSFASAASARTVPPELGFHGVTTPVAGSTAATRLRACAPIVLRTPPT